MKPEDLAYIHFNLCGKDSKLRRTFSSKGISFHFQNGPSHRCSYIYRGVLLLMDEQEAKEIPTR
jgi:hypothetical protein